MVRPRSGSPRSKPRPYSDSYHSEHHGERFGPSSRSPRGFRGPSGKAPPSWRENNSGGPHPYNKRPPLMGEPRERHWMSHNQDNFRPYAGSQDSQRGRRRPSPPRSNRPPPVQHRMSPHGSSHGPPGQHRPSSFHGNHSGHVSSSPRHFHGPPSDRRGPSPNSNFRPPQRHRSPAQEQDRSWGPERSFNRLTRGGHRWNGPGGYNHPNGEARFSGSPQRKPREFHERSSYPERWSAERDPRKQHGELGRQRGRPGHHSPDWAHREGCNPHHNRPPFRSPSWKAGPPPSSSGSSSRFHPPPPLHLQDRPPMRPLKRLGHPPSSSDVEHGAPKRFRRELSLRPVPPRGFGGRGLSLKDKSRLLKGRKFREESVARFKMPPPKPRPSDKVQKAKEQKTPRESQEEEDEDDDDDEVEEESSTGASSRSKAPVKKSVKRPGPRKLQPSEMDSKSADPERNTETQVESRRSVRAHSSSPIERQLTRDLVVVSHWEAGARPSSSPKDGPHWRNRPTKNNSSSRDSSLTLSERFGKLHNLGSSPHAQEVERRLSDGPEKTFRKPVPFQKPGLRPSLGFKKGPCPDGVFRRPLMATIIPRPPLHQKPVFRKSQSIMSKYRNLQTLRHKAPPHPRQATSYRRW